MTFRFLVFVFSGLLLVTGCAKRSNSIAPATVPVAGYQAMSCEQLVSELELERQKLNKASKSQNAAATADAVGVLFVLVPAGSLTGNDNEGEVATLKGKVISIESAMKSKNC